MSKQPPAYNELPPPPPYTPTAQAASQDSSSTVSLTINGVQFNVDTATDPQINSTTTLAQFIRQKTKWTGTKVSCNEGGCGACAVALTSFDGTTGRNVTRAVHACLRPVLLCNGMSVTTNEGLGDAKRGYHPIQKALAKFNGSQCGYCSNGFVMTMYSLLQSEKALTPIEVEQEFDGNVCRCTGYRQILHAMKTLISDDSCIKTGCQRRGIFPEVEELEHHLHHDESPIDALKTAEPRAPIVHSGPKRKVAAKDSDGHVWIECQSIADLNFWLNWYTSLGEKPMLVVGQTSLGVTKENPKIRLNIANIPDLQTITQNANGINIGPSVVIRDVIQYFRTCTTTPAYLSSHLAQAANHLQRVASYPLRNAGSIGGNLRLAHSLQSPDNFFPSDAVIVMCGLGASVTYYNPTTQQGQTVTMDNFYATDFTGCYFTNIFVPWAQENEWFNSYKIALRQVNSHAIVNAAMRAIVDPATNTISSQPTLYFGGIFATPQRAANIEQAMIGLSITNNTAFQALYALLNSWLDPTTFMGRRQFRKAAALGYFYKFLLFLQPSLPPNLQSGPQCWLTRGETSGTNAFTPDPKEYPVSIGMTKVEAIQQTSGHAVYTDDLGIVESALHATMVLTTQGSATISSIDTSAAASIPGFVAFYCAKDIDPSANAWVNGDIFCKGPVMYCGQCVGVVLATNAEASYACSQAVKVTYTSIQPPLVDINKAIAQQSFFNPQPPGLAVACGNASTAMKTAPNVVNDTVTLGWQYHFHLENQVAIAFMREDVMEIHCATQGPVMIQQQVSATLGLPISKIVVSNKRCGGGFGGKITNSILPAVIAAFAAVNSGSRVRLVMPMQQSMACLGARPSRTMNYTVGFKNDGEIIALESQVYVAGGQSCGDATGSALVTLHMLDNCYKIPNCTFNGTMVQMNTPAPSPVRGPGWVPAVALMETVIARIARHTGLTCEQIREKNFFKRGDTTADGMYLAFWTLPEVWSSLKASAGWDARVAAVAAYNQANRWTKRGLCMMPVRFGVGQTGANYDSLVNIYPDGSIAVTHGGTEIGQGINTKVIQILAYKLGLSVTDLPMITCNETSTRSVSSATNITGGSVTSELCGLSVMHACETLNRRLAPFRQPNQTWPQLIAAASGAGVELTATGWTDAPVNSSGIFNYSSVSACVTEVELDILTGEFEVKRVDIVFDCGISLNPLLDIGQVQGGFVFGQGLYVQELVTFDPNTGAPLNAGTWEYKPPCAYDVPEELNVTLLPKAPNPVGVLSSKASGEPPVALGISVVRAIEEAITSARSDAGIDTKRWVCPTTPLTVDLIQQACGTAPSQFVFTG